MSQRRKFKVTFSVEIEIEVDEKVLKDAKSKEFRASFYKLDDDAAVAQHLAYNFVANRADLKTLDGFAHWKKDMAKLVGEDWEFSSVEEGAKK